MNIASLLSRQSLKGIEARAGLERFAHNMASGLGISAVSIRWTGGTSTAAMSSGGEMLLADLGDAATVTRQTIAKYAGFIVHELLHRAYTDFRANDGRPYVASLHNAIEDAWIERRAIRSGLTGNVEGLLSVLVRDMVGQAMECVTDWADPAQFPFSLAVYCRGYGVTVPVPHELLPVWQEAARRVDACQSSHDTLEVALWVFDQLQQNQQQDGDKGQDAGDDAQDDAQDGNKGDDSQQDGRQDGQEGQDGQDGENAQDGQGQDAQGGQGAGDDGEPADAGPVKRFPAPHEYAREVEPSIEADDSAPGGSYSSLEVLESGKVGTYSEPVWDTDAQVPAKLRHQVRRLFENSAREWREGGFKSGTLHRPALTKVAMGQSEVFARRMSEDGVDSAVAICLDISGSMFPTGCGSIKRYGAQAYREMLGDTFTQSRINIAVGACAAMLDTLAQAGAESMVLAFGEKSHVIKTWGQPWRKVLPILRAIDLEGDTNDFAACRFATEALMRHPAERKVLMVITDGEGEQWRTAAQVKAAQALGIRVIGIGIYFDVRDTYGPESVSIERVSDLGAVAFGQMKAAA